MSSIDFFTKGDITYILDTEGEAVYNRGTIQFLAFSNPISLEGAYTPDELIEIANKAKELESAAIKS